ncbi:hypothetical protein GCM10027028_57070 [Streptomyces sundarbansensis]
MKLFPLSTRHRQDCHFSADSRPKYAGKSRSIREMAHRIPDSVAGLPPDLQVPEDVHPFPAGPEVPGPVPGPTRCGGIPSARGPFTHAFLPG